MNIIKMIEGGKYEKNMAWNSNNSSRRVDRGNYYYKRKEGKFIN